MNTYTVSDFDAVDYTVTPRLVMSCKGCWVNLFAYFISIFVALFIV